MTRADFAAYDASGKVRAVIEAKRRVGTRAPWAAAFRRNALAHSGIPADAIFILVTPDKLYSWPAHSGPDADPSFELEARSLFAPYFTRVGTTPESIEPVAFELLVSWWLNELARTPAPQVAEALRGSALLDALHGARVVRQDAA